MSQVGKNKKKVFRTIFIVLSALCVVLGLAWAYLFFSSSFMVRLPKMEHAHFRLQVVIEGRKENFAEAKYQQAYEKGVCSAELAKEPIHFHDSKDQIVHLHWKGATGGDVLKYYGWNLRSGSDTILGYRFDRFLIPEPVPIHGTSLPAISAQTKLWIYMGNQETYQQRNMTDFLNQNLEDFFSRKSSVNDEMAVNLQNFFTPVAKAHDGLDHTESKAPAQLEATNNLLGNVVIFVQQDEPTFEAIKERFNELEPLTDSTCGG